jgi:hypothetical protein
MYDVIYESVCEVVSVSGVSCSRIVHVTSRDAALVRLVESVVAGVRRVRRYAVHGGVAWSCGTHGARLHIFVRNGRLVCRVRVRSLGTVVREVSCVLFDDARERLTPDVRSATCRELRSLVRLCTA